METTIAETDLMNLTVEKGKLVKSVNPLNSSVTMAPNVFPYHSNVMELMIAKMDLMKSDALSPQLSNLQKLTRKFHKDKHST